MRKEILAYDTNVLWPFFCIFALLHECGYFIRRWYKCNKRDIWSCGSLQNDLNFMSWFEAYKCQLS